MTNPKHTDTSRSDLWAAMKDQLESWEFEDPRETWWKWQHQYAQAADLIEQLEREKAVVSDLWEQQKEIALGYLADCNKAADRIEALTAEVERLREALTDIGVYGCGMLNQPAALNGPEEAWLRLRIREMENVARAALGEKQ